MLMRTARGYIWGRRLLLAATLACANVLLVAGLANAKYVW
jgi:hypothetical protein